MEQRFARSIARLASRRLNSQRRGLLPKKKLKEITSFVQNKLHSTTTRTHGRVKKTYIAKTDSAAWGDRQRGVTRGVLFVQGHTYTPRTCQQHHAVHYYAPLTPFHKKTSRRVRPSVVDDTAAATAAAQSGVTRVFSCFCFWYIGRDAHAVQPAARQQQKQLCDFWHVEFGTKAAHKA